jgi:hypothetical protein
VRIALAAAALALWIVPPAGAMFGPPIFGIASTNQRLPIIHLKETGDRSPSSCSVHARRPPAGAAGRIERKLAPVACEQPPRVKMLDTGFFFTFRP